MEKLELLSRTALLKQGIDGTRSSSGNANGTHQIVVLGGQNDNRPTGIPVASPNPLHLLPSAPLVAKVVAPPRSGDGQSHTTAPQSYSININGGVSSHLASPVSTDGEDDDDVGEIRSTPSFASSKTRHNLHSAKARIIESRSPVPTSEYTRNVSITSPFPSENQYPFTHIHHFHDQQDHAPPPPPSHYNNNNNHNPNIIRTLSEASFHPPYGNHFMPTSSPSLAAAGIISSESEGAFHPPQLEARPPYAHLQQRRESSTSREDMARQIIELREQLSDKDMVVSSLQHRVSYLENQIHELRQLPTGKISHIPVDDMIRIMQEYGSEVSNQTLPQQRKQSIKKASIVRQFRRWNPDFFRFFLHHNGEWVPKLGREGELRRRAEKRRLLLIAKQSSNMKISNGTK